MVDARSPALHRSCCSLASVPSLAAACSRLPPDRNEAASSLDGQQRSPACPLHGVFLSEAHVRKVGSAVVHSSSSREQRGGAEGLWDGTGGSNTDQDSSCVHSSDVCKSTISAHCRRWGSAEVDPWDNGSSTEDRTVRDTSESSLVSTSEEEENNDKSGRPGWSSENGKGRALVIVHNCVYDLTDFNHPGGEELLESRYGTDITGAFEEAGHSAAAYKLLNDYLVGIVAERREAYIEQVGGAVCVCPGRSTGSKEPICASGIAGDAVCEEQRVSSSAETGQATQLPNTSEDLGELQYGPPKFIPSGPDGLPLHPFIDFHRPLLPQIWNLSKEKYIQLVNSHSLTTRVVRLMPYAWMEPFSKTHWWMVPLLWTPWTLFLLHLSCATNCAAAVVAMVALGIAMWTLVEYILHRFVFHFPEAWLPDFSAVRVAHFLMHAVHHVLPLDPLRLVVPPLLLAFLSVLVYAALSLVLPQWLIWGGWPGGMIGYMAYDMVHYSTHHYSVISRFSHVRKMKVYHMRHHFKHPMLGFGVSNKVWDHIFGTTPPS